MTSITQRLSQIGLTENQALVYLTLFRSGESKAGDLIKKTGLHRNLVYVALKELVKKKLVMSTRVRNVAVFRVLYPSRLLSEAQEKERIAKGLVEEFAVLSKKANNQEVTVYEGVDEFRRHAIRSHSIAKPESLMRYLGTSEEWHTAIGASLEKELSEIQQEKQLRMYGITKEEFPHLEQLIKNSQGLSKIRFNHLVASDTNNIEILDDRVSIQSFTEPYLVIEVVNPELAKNYQNYFDFLWENSTPKDELDS